MHLLKALNITAVAFTFNTSAAADTFIQMMLMMMTIGLFVTTTTARTARSTTARGVFIVAGRIIRYGGSTQFLAIKYFMAIIIGVIIGR